MPKDIITDKEEIKTKIDHYNKMDYRLKCRCCGEWMRDHPTKNSPKKRNKVPRASVCTECFQDCKKNYTTCAICPGKPNKK